MKNRHKLILLDNCSANGSRRALPDLKSTKSICFPSNTTSKLQQCDAIIVAALKVPYRSFQPERGLDLAEYMELSNIYKVDII